MSICNTNIHTFDVSKRHSSYCYFIYPSTFNSKDKKEQYGREDVLLLLNQEHLPLKDYSPLLYLPTYVFQAGRFFTKSNRRTRLTMIHNQLIDPTDRSFDLIKPFENGRGQPTNRRSITSFSSPQSSVQILDLKFIHTLSNQTDNESNIPINASRKTRVSVNRLLSSPLVVFFSCHD